MEGRSTGGFHSYESICIQLFNVVFPSYSGQESWKVDGSSFIQWINCAKFSSVGIVMLCGVVHTVQAL